MTQSSEGNQQEIRESASEEVSRDPKFEIGDFLEDNYPLFTVLSIFGAISIYIFGLRDGVTAEKPVIVGFVSSQFLLLLSAYAIYKRILGLMGGFSNLLDYILHQPSKDSLELLVFLVAFTSLVVSFLSVNSEFTGSVSLLFQALALPIGYGITIALIEYLDEGTDFSIETGSNSSIIEKLKLILFSTSISCVVILISVHFFTHVDSSVVFGIPEKDFLDPVVSAFFVGSGLVGGIYAVISIFTLIEVARDLIIEAAGWIYSRVIEFMP